MKSAPHAASTPPSTDARPPGRSGRRRLWKRVAARLDLVVAIPLVLGLLAIPAWWGYDTLARDAARKTATAHWREAQPAIEARLHQQLPLEYGAVWSTHAGLICGLVNGWGSFGGMSGMTRFYMDRGRPVFSPDVDSNTFTPGWGRCVADPWLFVHPGSMKFGWCATRAGAKRCAGEDW